MRKVWQKVGESADVSPEFMYVDVPPGPPMQLENSRRRSEDESESAGRCMRDAMMAYYQLPKVFERCEVRK